MDTQSFFYRKFGKPEFGNRQQIQFLHAYSDIMSGAKPVVRRTAWRTGIFVWDLEEDEFPFFKQTSKEESNVRWCYICCPRCNMESRYAVWDNPFDQEDGFLECPGCTLEFTQKPGNTTDVWVKQEEEA